MANTYHVSNRKNKKTITPEIDFSDPKVQYPRGTTFHSQHRVGVYKIKRHFDHGFIEVAELLDEDQQPVNNPYYAKQQSKDRVVMHVCNI